jgi:hypothetical protein
MTSPRSIGSVEAGLISKIASSSVLAIARLSRYNLVSGLADVEQPINAIRIPLPESSAGRYTWVVIGVSIGENRSA